MEESLGLLASRWPVGGCQGGTSLPAPLGNLTRPVPLADGDGTLPCSMSQAHRQRYSRSQETLGVPGQCQAGDEADDQVQDEEQEVGEPPGWRGWGGQWDHGRILLTRSPAWCGEWSNLHSSAPLPLAPALQVALSQQEPSGHG